METVSELNSSTWESRSTQGTSLTSIFVILTRNLDRALIQYNLSSPKQPLFISSRNDLAFIEQLVRPGHLCGGKQHHSNFSTRESRTKITDLVESRVMLG